MDPSVALIRSTLNATSKVSPGLAGWAAFQLFRRPIRRGRVRSAELEVHARAVTETLTVNGRSVVAYRWGDGSRPVLLVHGWQSRASRYAEFIPRLQALGLSPVSFDAPGHGDSGGRATTILEYQHLIGQLHDRYGPFHSIVAHSFGVTCAFLALRSGVKAERLVALSGVAEFDFLVDSFCAGLGLNDRIKRELVRRMEGLLLAGRDGGREEFDATYRAEQLDIPILVVHDQDDAMVPLRQAHLLKEAYGERVELLVTRRLGHNRILGEPAVIDNAMGFLG